MYIIRIYSEHNMNKYRIIQGINYDNAGVKDSWYER